MLQFVWQNGKIVSFFDEILKVLLFFFDKMWKIFHFFRQNAKNISNFLTIHERWFTFLAKCEMCFFFWQNEKCLNFLTIHERCFTFLDNRRKLFHFLTKCEKCFNLFDKMRKRFLCFWQKTKSNSIFTSKVFWKPATNDQVFKTCLQFL